MDYKKNITMKKDDVLALYENAGWSSYTKDPEGLMKGIRNSLDVYSVWNRRELIGLARIIGDASTIIYIQDILIKKQYQRRGIGKSLMKMITDDYDDVRQIVLITDLNESTDGFYASAGFTSADKIGCRAYLRIKGE